MPLSFHLATFDLLIHNPQSAHNCAILYNVGIFMIRLPTLMQYIHVFMPHRQPRLIYWSTMSLIGLNFMAYLVLTILLVLDCNPIKIANDPWDTGEHCIHILPAMFENAASVMSTISDLFILLMPQFFIWRLNMSVMKRRDVSMIFMVAVLSV